MSFHKCWNLALTLLTYNDIHVYGQCKYLLSVYQYWLDLYLWQGRNLHLNYDIICPSSLPFHIIHIVLPRVFIVAFYIQLRVMQNMLNSMRTYYKWYSGVLYSRHETAQKKQFPSPNTLTEILPRSDNLDSNDETELTCLVHGTFLSLFIWVQGPGFSSTLLLSDELPIVFVHKSTFNLNHVHQFKHRQLTYCVFGFLFVQKANTVFVVLGSNNV